MLSIPGFDIVEKLHESSHSQVYRARRSGAEETCILKVLNKEYPRPEELARFRQEYEIIKNLDIDGVTRVFGLEPYNNSLLMVLEDFGGDSLARILKKRKLNLQEFLEIGIQLVLIIAEIHARQIMHKDICPANIIWNTESNQVKIIDFGISAELSWEHPQVESAGLLEGTLLYMSPEQTGRMNRAMDYRTDFYSLGITFYEMLLGAPPFQSDEMIELIHCHIAQEPGAPADVNSDISPTLSAIIMKLLAKTAEERYQSAFGLKRDLEICLAEYREKGSIGNFQIAADDVSDRFQIPQNLYGREEEVGVLMETFQKVSQGGRELLLVAGRAGIGKSSLVQEVHRPITETRGYFISGKFEQYKRNIPYLSLTQSFKGLVRRILTEGAEEIKVWEDKILTALGENAGLIVDVIPEVELIIGKQPAVPVVLPGETQNRFIMVFRKFVQVFASRNHPLVLFLDDLQWADSSSLQLIELLLSDTDVKFVFIIGAYRHNEVNQGHPLTLTLENLSKAGVKYRELLLGPLDNQQVNRMISDTLKCSLEEGRSLADSCLEKTHGNPFFLNQFLQNLFHEGLLSFNARRGRWEWDFERIAGMDVTANVVELMSAKIMRLDEEFRKVINIASCIGNQFDLRTLALVNQSSEAHAALLLRESIKRGLIIPLDVSYKYAHRIGAELVPAPGESAPGNAEPGVEQRAEQRAEQRGGQKRVELKNIHYKFLHDRVQQAAYSQLELGEKERIHLVIGRLMLENIPEHEREENLFQIVGQLNLGKDLIKESNERILLAHLNLKAGRTAKSSSAFELAGSYFTLGRELTGSNWDKHYQLTLALFTEGAETAYLDGNYEELTRLGDEVLSRAQSLPDKIKIYEIQIQATFAQDKMPEALSLGIETLKMLGINFPEKPGKIHVLIAILKIRRTLRGKSNEDLFNLPDMEDRTRRTAVRILNILFTAAYFVDASLLPLLGFQIVHLSVKYGNTPWSSQGYNIYAVILEGVLGKLEEGYRYGQLAMRLNKRFPYGQFNGRSVQSFNGFIRHWSEHADKTVPALLEAYCMCLDRGDLEYAGLSVYMYCYHAYLVGKDLRFVEREMRTYHKVLVQLNQAVPRVKLEFFQNSVNILVAETPPEYDDIARLGETFNNPDNNPDNDSDNSSESDEGGGAEKDEDEESENIDSNDLFALNLNKQIIAYTFGDYENALVYSDLAWKHLSPVSMNVAKSPAIFYDSLIRLALYEQASSGQKRKFRRQVKKNQKHMKKWAAHAEMNHKHKYLLVEAELYRVRGQDYKAMEYYDLAVHLARENEYIQEEALAYELASRYYLDRNKEIIARAYMREAHYVYTRWGATAKVAQLDEKYPHMFVSFPGKSDPATSSLRQAVTATSHGENTKIDIETVVRASRAIEGEILLPELLRKLMTILLESAGARKGYLLLAPQNVKKQRAEDIPLYIEAEGSLEQDTKNINVLHSIPIVGKNTLLPLSVINYTKRSREYVVLNNARDEERFSDDVYLRQNNPASVLCAPVMFQNNIMGVLYLENNLARGTFTDERLDILRVLSSLAAISIQNARLLEERLRSERMSVVGHMATGIVHDLKNPITFIKCFAELAGDDALGSEQRHEYLNYIMEGADRLNDMARDILEFIKGDITLDIQEVNGEEYLRDIHSSLNPGFEEHGIVLSYRLNYGGKINVDPARFRRVIYNIASNAREAMLSNPPGDGGTHQFTIELTLKEEDILFVFIDSGPGIPPEIRQDFFEPFVTFGKGQGTGLGMAMVKKLVEEHKGKINFDTGPRGTRFNISLPLNSK